MDQIFWTPVTGNTYLRLLCAWFEHSVRKRRQAHTVMKVVRFTKRIWEILWDHIWKHMCEMFTNFGVKRWDLWYKDMTHAIHHYFTVSVGYVFLFILLTRNILWYFETSSQSKHFRMQLSHSFVNIADFKFTRLIVNSKHEPLHWNEINIWQVQKSTTKSFKQLALWEIVLYRFILWG